jgi:hypothetical protein
MADLGEGLWQAKRRTNHSPAFVPGKVRSPVIATDAIRLGFKSITSIGQPLPERYQYADQSGL